MTGFQLETRHTKLKEYYELFHTKLCHDLTFDISFHFIVRLPVLAMKHGKEMITTSNNYMVYVSYDPSYRTQGGPQRMCQTTQESDSTTPRRELHTLAIHHFIPG